jgi:hypothetical protein
MKAINTQNLKHYIYLILYIVSKIIVAPRDQFSFRTDVPNLLRPYISLKSVKFFSVSETLFHIIQPADTFRMLLYIFIQLFSSSNIRGQFTILHKSPSLYYEFSYECHLIYIDISAVHEIWIQGSRKMS